MLYPQNGDRIVAVDSVTSLRPICSLDGMSLYVAASVNCPMLGGQAIELK